jgi:hypothetical protein
LTNPIVLVTNILIQSALKSVKERTDPLIDRVNAGEPLNLVQSHSVLNDMYNLVNVVIESNNAMNTLQAKVDEQAKEIETMKALLGLSDTNTEENPAK